MTHVTALRNSILCGFAVVAVAGCGAASLTGNPGMVPIEFEHQRARKHEHGSARRDAGRDARHERHQPADQWHQQPAQHHQRAAQRGRGGTEHE